MSLVDESYMRELLAYISENRYYLYNYHFSRYDTSVKFNSTNYGGGFSFDVVLPGKLKEDKKSVLENVSFVALSGCYGRDNSRCYAPIYAEVFTDVTSPYIRVYIQSLNYNDTDTYYIDVAVNDLTMYSWEV